MTRLTSRWIAVAGLAAAAWGWAAASAEAVVGAPATPVSYAGVARPGWACADVATCR